MRVRPHLIGEDFSPWTEKARWALDHHGVDYSFKQYQPLLEEAWLRIKTRNWTGKATVPVLIAGSERLTDSFAISRWAEDCGGGPPLIAQGAQAQVAMWNARSERALRAGRALFLARLNDDPAAQLDNVPPSIPPRLRPFMRPAVRMGVAYLRAKHGADAAALARAADELHAELAVLRSELANRAGYLLERFSYADIAMAVACQFISPVNDPAMPLTPANRACWTHEAIAAQYPDIVRWRDGLYAAHRHRDTARPAPA